MESREARIDIPDEDPGETLWHKIFHLCSVQKKYRPMWHKIFLLCCVVAASLDPLFFYIPIINDKKKCLGMDEKLKKTILVLKSVMDLTYIFHIAFQIIFEYLAYASESDKVIDWIMGTIRRRKWWIILIDILCVLPIPQVVILIYFSKIKGSESLNTRKFLNFILFQFAPRIFRIYLSCKELTKNLSLHEIVEAAWVKGLFNFFLYIIASHVMGAFWYFFSVQRESACWQHACRGNSMCNQSTFFCEHRYDVVDDPIIGYLNQSCPLIPSSHFDFGMFTTALQSGIVNSMDFPRKFLYCFAWGLRNLSSFGSNLQTSTYFWESLFSSGITVIGVLLFIYFIVNLQFSAKALVKRRRKMKTKGPKIDTWIKINEIPRDMRKELMDEVSQKMHENEEVNLKNLLDVLPTQSKKRIKRILCLPILKKVARLAEMSDESIDEIFIDHLKPVIFNEHSEIFKEGEPLTQMLFFTQGSALVYSTAGTTPIEFVRGGFYGEELLEWALTAPSSSIPISRKTVKTNTKVEAFALEFPDMEKIASPWREWKMKTKGPEIDTWIKNNKIPPDMREELMDGFRQKMHENEEVNLKNLLNVLPTQSMKRIKQRLCLPILKKVERLKNMSAKSIDEIFIDHLKPVIFNEHSEIFKEGEPLSQMLFFTQGSAWVYSTAGTTPVELERGGFYGEELLEWALTAPSSSIPISRKTVKTNIKVEAFALEFPDMEKIASSWRKWKMKTKGPEIDTWIKNNEIPPDMREELMDGFRQKMHENEEVNLKNLLNVLPTQSKKRIKQILCLPILKKVARFAEMSDEWIDEIFIDHLKPVIFNEHTEIFKEGEPLSQMLFFTQGSAWVYSTASITIVDLESGDFYGEELLELALRAPSSSIPISRKTVTTNIKVEAFALEFPDIEKITSSWRKRKMKTKGPEIDTWIKNNEIPPDMREELMDGFRQQMHVNEEVNLKNLLNVLPTQSKKRIKQSLCLPILKKVARLAEMSDKLIDEIFIDHLKPVIFNEHSEIFREGEPLGRMLFFTQGSAWVYLTAGTTPVELERGGFYGEELLEWALTATSSPIPISHKTVKTNIKVEAFALGARDMKKIAGSWRLRSTLSPILPMFQ